MIKILLLGGLDREPARQLAKGLSRYGRDHFGGCRFYQVSRYIQESREHASDIAETVKTLGIDAIFGGWKGIDLDVARSMNIPIVLRQRKEDVAEFPVIKCNNEAVGRMAAAFLRKCGYNNLSFSGFSNVIWSNERFAAFKDAAGESMSPPVFFSNGTKEWSKIKDWLVNLPKPVGIFACNDVNAKILIEICTGLGISIPEDVAILGTDDDSLLCDITSPTISTIKLDFETLGYNVGKFMQKEIISGKRDNSIIQHDPVQVIERESTPRQIVTDPYVLKVLEFMQKHFTEEIGISDAIADIPLTRRAIELRFRAQMGNATMLHTLTSLRVEEMKRLLSSTDKTVYEIALLSGFGIGSNVNRIFRQWVNCSPLEYRRLHTRE